MLKDDGYGKRLRNFSYFCMSYKISALKIDYNEKTFIHGHAAYSWCDNNICPSEDFV